MKIKKLHIQNFKSLVDFQLEDMPQFCAFVGPNASGKSNIFEGIEFANYFLRFVFQAPSFFKGHDAIFSYSPKLTANEKRTENLGNQLFEVKFNSNIDIFFRIQYDNHGNISLITSRLLYPNISVKENEPFSVFKIQDIFERNLFVEEFLSKGNIYENEFEIFYDNFSRIFVGKVAVEKVPIVDTKLSPSAKNTAQILGQIFQDDAKREDFIEWLRILIPEFENIAVKKNEFDGSFHIFLKEKSHNKHFPVTLLSDGTKNILALMAAVYQSNQPQFLCIEEPENGLHPHAIELLVDFFREKCETEGHHIWLNTHSPTLVRCLSIEEVITVNKINGETKARQFKKEEAVNMKMDEAWLTNALGGGVSWSK